MNTMLSEIEEMPVFAAQFLDRTAAYKLPMGVPYLGMGSSYFAPLAFKYMGLNIYPELASEFYGYLFNGDKMASGVLLSQSGRSSEVLWCAELFDEYVAITNDAESPLGLSPASSRVISLLAGEEKYSSSKTYINTLLCLFKGFGHDMAPSVRRMSENMGAYERQGSYLADAVFELLTNIDVTGIYITGSGPNIATALQAALILSESTKIGFNGMAMAQYDHGPKETARNSIVIQIIAKGASYDRTNRLANTVRTAGGHIFQVEAPVIAEHESILHNIIPFNFMAYHLAEKLMITETFRVGGKVTEVDLFNGGPTHRPL